MGTNYQAGRGQRDGNSPTGRDQKPWVGGRSAADDNTVGRATEVAHKPGPNDGDRVSNPSTAIAAAQPQGANQVAATPGQLGILKLTDDQKRALSRIPDPAEIEIRPDGLIYAPWTAYADVLDEAFGIGGWTLVPEGRPSVQDGFVMWQFHLFVQGRFVATAIGEHPDPGNRRMSLANRAEAAKSDALVKCCKALGVFRDLWRTSYCQEWQARYAERVYALQNEWSTKPVWLWRRKDRHPFYKEAPPKKLGSTEYDKPMRVVDEAEAHFAAIEEE
jgi:hypothetical protein